jgi:hypothetical protein
VKTDQKNTLKLIIFISFLLLLVLVSQEMNFRYSQSSLVSENWESLSDSKRVLAHAYSDRGLNWEYEMTKIIYHNEKDQKKRQAASFDPFFRGSVHRDLSSLTLGELAGNYRIVTQPQRGGRVFIKELEFVDSMESVSKPLLLADSVTFLNQNRYLFGLDEISLQLDASSLSPSPSGSSSALPSSGSSKGSSLSQDKQNQKLLLVERYQLKNIEGKPVDIELEKDSSGRLIRLSIHHEE